MKLSLFLLSICLVGTALASQKPNYIKFTCNAPMWTGTWYGKNDDCSTAAGMTKPSVIEFDKCVTHTMNTGWKVKYAKGTNVTESVFKTSADCSGTADETNMYTPGTCLSDVYMGFKFKIQEQKDTLYAYIGTNDKCTGQTDLIPSGACSILESAKITCSADKKKVTYEVFEPKKKCATVLKTHKDLETEKCLSHPDNVLAAPAENSAFSTMKSGIVSMVFTAILAIIFTF